MKTTVEIPNDLYRQAKAEAALRGRKLKDLSGLDVLVVDAADSEMAKDLEHSRLRVHCTNIMMRTAQEKLNLAREVLSQVACEVTAHSGSERL